MKRHILLFLTHAPGNLLFVVHVLHHVDVEPTYCTAGLLDKSLDEGVHNCVHPAGLTCCPGGLVVGGAADPHVGDHGGVGPLWTADRCGTESGGRVQGQSLLGEVCIEGLQFV